MSNELKEMSFWEHVEDLRKVILRSVGAIILLAIVFFALMPHIFDSVILAPCHSDFVLYRWLCALNQHMAILPDFCNDQFEVKLINIQLASQFFIHMSTSMWLALLVAFPYVIYQLWSFVSPGLYAGEKRHARGAFLAGNIMFFIGIAVGYFLVFPLTLRFLAEYQVSEMVPNQISLDSYMNNFLTLNFIMGLVFELPLLCWILSNMGLITRQFFKTHLGRLHYPVERPFHPVGSLYSALCPLRNQCLGGQTGAERRGRRENRLQRLIAIRYPAGPRIGVQGDSHQPLYQGER